MVLLVKTIFPESVCLLGVWVTSGAFVGSKTPCSLIGLWLLCLGQVSPSSSSTGRLLPDLWPLLHARQAKEREAGGEDAYLHFTFSFIFNLGSALGIVCVCVCVDVDVGSEDSLFFLQNVQVIGLHGME